MINKMFNRCKIVLKYYYKLEGGDLVERKLLLNNIAKITNKYEEIYRKTGQYFNVFSIAGIEHDEVKICRILKELLDPKGSHYQKEKYLKLFVKNILKINIDDDEYRNVLVYNEYLIDNNRRIDIVIKFEKYFIPIEVKIYADDQDKQCFDYYTYASEKSEKEIQVIYLTLDGHIPSKSSVEGLTPINENINNKNVIVGYEEVRTISFKDDIMMWLEECISDIDTLKIASIREVIMQFMNVIKNLTNLIEGDEKMEMIDEIMSSRGNMKAACEIGKLINDAKKKIMEKIFIDIENIMKEKCDNHPIEKITDVNYYEYQDKIKDYYNKKESSYPGLNYVCNKIKLKNDLELWFRIEIEDILFCGFCLFDRKNNKQFDKLSDEIYEEIKLQIPNIKINQDGWWISWYRIPNDDSTPNFQREEDNLFNLFDKKYYENFINQCMNEIDKVLDLL